MANRPLPTVKPPLPTAVEPTAPANGNPNLVIALAKITVNHPTEEMVHIGGYDKNGDPIVRKACLIIEPGQFFEMADAAERANLLNMGAICYPTQSDLLLRGLETEGR